MGRADDWSGLKRVVVMSSLAVLSWVVMALVIYAIVHVLTS
jgi:hypothetical protein